ncbi:MAG TPA: hypothetical protein VHR72_07855 [Gemmataceae bacterium]|jgi:hypothetical protein|nr:hypothetical protein [Gemmataceae bacterium]
MIRRRIAAVALAAGCLLSQTGCTGFGSSNTCPNTSSGCFLTSGGGLFSRMFGSSAPPATACCTPTCTTASPCSACSSGAPLITSGFESSYVGAPVGGSPGCGCNRDPFQFTGMQGAAPAPIMTTMPGPISQGVPISAGPDMMQPIPSTPFIPAPQPAPLPNQGPPRIVPVPQMQPPVGAGFQQWHP